MADRFVLRCGNVERTVRIEKVSETIEEIRREALGAVIEVRRFGLLKG